MSPFRRTIAAALLAGCAAVAGCDRPGPGPGAEAVEVAAYGTGALVSVRNSDGTRQLWEVRPDGSIAGRVTGVAPEPKTEDCRGSLCYRVDGERLRVTLNDAPVWEVSGTDYDQLVADYGGMRPRSMAIAVRPVDAGHVVFVANGRDGVLYRDEDGRWQRFGLPRGGEGWYWQEPPRLLSDPEPFDPGPGVGIGTALLVLLIGLTLLGARRMLRSWWTVVVVAAALVAGALAWVASHAPAAGMLPAAMVAAMGVGIILCTALAAVAAMAVLVDRRPR
jgi:hypothetical protein